jgi:hypothetical protein
VDARVPDAAFTTSSGESLHSLAEVVAASSAAGSAGTEVAEVVAASSAAGSATEVGEAAASFVDATAAELHAIPHAAFSAPVLVAHPMKQVAHAGAEPIIPITTGVGSAAVATNMNCCSVHGPSAADAGPVSASRAKMTVRTNAQRC